MADMMTFPNTWEEFEEQYGITDREQIYTNGARLIPSFRVKQWLDHIAEQTEPQTDEPTMDEYYKDHDEFYDCDRYVITNDEGERAYNCIGCERTDCSWK